MTVIEYIKMGGAINWILFAAFLTTFFIAFERIIYFAATAGKRNQRSQSARMRRISRETAGIPGDTRNEILERQGTLLYEEMKKGLWIISFLSAASPSLGLLGTVLGLIRAFQDMAGSGATGSIEEFSAGIWMAMLTTACGLIVALPALFFSRFFSAVIAGRSLSITMSVDEDLNGKEYTKGARCAQVS